MAKRKAKTPRNSLRTEKKEDGRGKNPNSLANLRPFEPGVSGNPGGRPKGLGDAYREWLATINESDPQKRTNAQLGAVAIGLEMLKGDVSAAREIRAATEGETVRIFKDMTDAELDEFIAARQRTAGAGADGTGETQPAAKENGPDTRAI